MKHVPVMAGEVLELLSAADRDRLLDLTVGAGGHAGEFLAASAPTARVIAADRDEVAIAEARRRLEPFGGRVRYVHADWVSTLALLAGEGERPDAILMDLGASSMQLDDSLRGFSLQKDARLDMRMDAGQGPTATDFLAMASEEELTRALVEWGGEPRGARIARAIVERRRERPLHSTGDLRRLVEEVLGRRGGRIHPATRAFQGVRMAVNREAEQLSAALPAAWELLAPGGRMAVLTFHSGEDRVVKTFFREAAATGGRLLTRKAISPSRKEQAGNRRSRSAHLRGIAKEGGAP